MLSVYVGTVDAASVAPDAGTEGPRRLPSVQSSEAWVLDWTGGTDFRISEHNVIGCEVQGNVIITTQAELEDFYAKVRAQCGPETPYIITGYLRVWNSDIFSLAPLQFLQSVGESGGHSIDI